MPSKSGFGLPQPIETSVYFRLVWRKSSDMILSAMYAQSLEQSSRSHYCHVTVTRLRLCKHEYVILMPVIHLYDHARTKSGIMKCLRTRAEKVCHTTRLTGELNHLKQVFRANGYPTRTVNCNLSIHPSPNHPPTQSEEQEMNNPKSRHLPYVRGVSKRIERKCRKLGIRTTFKLKGTIREALVRTKEPQPEWKKKGVIYQVPCGDCNSIYIGETERTLEKRISEHKAVVKRHDEKNGIAVLAWNNQHKVDWQETKVLQTETNYSKRRTMEAVHIHQQQLSSNLDCGRNLSPVWHPLL